MMSPLPRGLAFYNRPPVDDLHAWAGTRGYSFMVALRSFARCNWEFGEKDFDFAMATRRNDGGGSNRFTASKVLCDGKNLSWDASRHLSDAPDLFCRTPCFSTTLRSAIVVELSLIDELGNIVWGTVEVARLQTASRIAQSASGNKPGEQPGRILVSFAAAPRFPWMSRWMSIRAAVSRLRLGWER